MATRSKRKRKSRSNKKTATKKSASSNGKSSGDGNGKDAADQDSVQTSWDDLPNRWTARSPLLILAVLAVLYTLYFAGAVLFPILLALLLYFLLSPVVRWLSKKQLPDAAGAALVVLGLAGCTVGLAFAIAGPAAMWMEDGPRILDNAKDKLQFVTEPIEDLNQAKNKVEQMAKEAGGEEVQEVRITPPTLTDVLFDAGQEAIAGTVIVVVLLFLLLAVGHRTLNTIVEMMPTVSDKRSFVELTREIESGISRYLLTTTGINLCLGVVIGTAMYFLGMPYPLLLGVVACLVNFIPYLGCLVGCGLVFLIGLDTFPTAGEALVPPLVYFAINAVEGNFITPMVLGRQLSLNPVLVFLSLVFWGWLWGVGGVLIAVPVLGTISIVCAHFQRLQPIAKLLSG